MIHENHTLREFPTASGWRATTGQIQTVDSDESAGYDRTWIPRPPGQLAVIPVDSLVGYSRALGSRSRVVILGRSAPVMGRVCTNIIMAEISDIQGFAIRDDLVPFGRNGYRRITAEEAVNPSETFNSEFVVRQSPEIPRIVVS
jgi:alanine racemase